MCITKKENNGCWICRLCGCGGFRGFVSLFVLRTAVHVRITSDGGGEEKDLDIERYS